MEWTSERVETLRRLWLQGQTASQIAAQLGETTRNVVNGSGNTWGYRGWVMNGVDAACTQQNGHGINVWDRGPTRPTRIPGRLGSWSWVGSTHPRGANIALGDGALALVSANAVPEPSSAWLVLIALCTLTAVRSNRLGRYLSGVAGFD
jgi:hypothetical protein